MDKHNSCKQIPAILLVDSPWSVCKLDPNLFSSLSPQIIILLDEDQHAAQFFNENDVIINCPLMDRYKLLALQKKLSSTYQIIAVVGFSEISVFATALLAEACCVSGIGPDVAMACRNKFTMASQLSRGGVTMPAYFLYDPNDKLNDGDLLRHIDRIGSFPVVCKPLMGFASGGVIRANNFIELKQAIHKIRIINKVIMARYYDDAMRLSQVLVQSYIEGLEFAIDGYVQNGKANIISIIDKPDVSHGPYFNDSMHILPSRQSNILIDKAQITVQATIAALGLNDTPFHLEARLNEGKLYILEVAARIGFMHSIHDALGIDLCAITLALKMGTNSPAEPIRQRFAGNYCITAKETGHFVKITNLDQLLANPCIVALPMFVKPGDRVAPPPHGNAYIGFILVAANTYQEVQDTLIWAANQIDVTLE